MVLKLGTCWPSLRQKNGVHSLMWSEYGMFPQEESPPKSWPELKSENFEAGKDPGCQHLSACGASIDIIESIEYPWKLRETGHSHLALSESIANFSRKSEFLRRF